MNIKHLMFLASFLCSFGVAADKYTIDVEHSSINFTVNHLGFSKTVGRFNSFSGTFSDEEGKEKVSVTIDSASIDTNHAERNKHLRSKDFFNVKQYPQLEFIGTEVKNNTLLGKLTLNGVSKPVTLDFSIVGEGKDPWGGYRKGFEAKTVIKRSEWGISHFLPGVSDEVEIVIQIEGIKL